MILKKAENCVIHIMDIRGGEIQPLGPGRRHNMRRVAGKHQPAKSHRLGHKTAQWCDTLFDGRARFQRFGHVRRQAQAEFIPEGVITPVFNLVIRITLDVVARPRHRPHRAEGKSACGIGIDHLFGNRLCV